MLERSATVINLSLIIEFEKEIKATGTLEYPMNTKLILMKDCVLEHRSYSSMRIDNNVYFQRSKVPGIDPDDKPDIFYLLKVHLPIYYGWTMICGCQHLSPWTHKRGVTPSLIGGAWVSTRRSSGHIH